MIRNLDGLIALRHHNSNPATIKMEVDGTLYSFVPKLSVSLAWVKPEHVDALLRTQTRVCCGRSGPKFRLANEMDCSLWEMGKRPTPEFLSKYQIT